MDAVSAGRAALDSADEVEARAEMRRLEKRTRHACPPWCHHCPILRLVIRESRSTGSDIMPACMGVAVHPTMDACTCDKRKLVEARERGFEERIAALEMDVAELNAQLAAERSKGRGASHG